MGSGTGTPIAANTTTLTTLRDRIEMLLADSTNLRFSTDMLNESIKLALAHYTKMLPHTALGEITLTSDGREIDVSSLTYINIVRAWWDFDNSDPTHPPNWRSFEEWPGDILYINDPEEPATGDIIRFWYTAPNTLNGLNSQSITTFPAYHDTYMVSGSAGYAALSRAINRTEKLNIDGWTHQRLRVWGNELIHQFELALQAVVSQHAARASGIVASPPLDRWDVPGW